MASAMKKTAKSQASEAKDTKTLRSKTASVGNRADGTKTRVSATSRTKAGTGTATVKSIDKAVSKSAARSTTATSTRSVKAAESAARKTEKSISRSAAAKPASAQSKTSVTTKKKIGR